MAKELVVHRKGLSKYRGEFSQRAAQYVRMSTIHQRYSIENQAAAIAAVTARNGPSPIHRLLLSQVHPFMTTPMVWPDERNSGRVLSS